MTKGANHIIHHMEKIVVLIVDVVTILTRTMKTNLIKTDAKLALGIIQPPILREITEKPLDLARSRLILPREGTESVNKVYICILIKLS